MLQGGWFEAYVFLFQNHPLCKDCTKLSLSPMHSFQKGKYAGHICKYLQSEIYLTFIGMNSAMFLKKMGSKIHSDPKFGRRGG
jgi:hypothetical protein